VRNVGWGVVPFGTIWGDNLLIRDRFHATIATFNRAAGTASWPGSGYTRFTTITVPSFCFGEVYLVAVVDSSNAVVETTDDDNEAVIPLICLPQPTADLVPTSLFAVVSELGVIELTWTVTNVGQTIIGPHSRWQDVCSLATSNQTDDPSRSLTLLATFTFILPLVSQASWTNTRFVAIPPGLPVGNYYVMCTVDAEHEVAEGDDGESNNVVFTTTALSLTLTATTPWTALVTADLAVAAVHGSFVVGYSRISVDFVVTNVGGSDAVALPRWHDAIGVSTEGTWDPTTGILLLPSIEHTTTLPVGASYNVTSMTALVPRDITGEVHVFVITDIGRIVADNNRSNNVYKVTELPINLSVTAATLTSAGVTAPSTASGSGSSTDPVVVVIGSTIELSVCSNNTGSSPAVGPWYDEIVLSDDTVVDGGDIRLARVKFTDDIATGAIGCVAVSVSFSRVPIGLGLVLHAVDVSSSVTDRNEYAEATGRLAVHVMPPPSADLEVTAVNDPIMLTLNGMGNVSVNVTVSNVGVEQGRGDICFVLFASMGLQRNADDVWLVDQCAENVTLLPDQTHEESFVFPLPIMRAGNYRIVAVVNGERLFPEHNYFNNNRTSNGTIAVTVPYITSIPTAIQLAPGEQVLVRVSAPGAVGVTINISSSATAQDAFNKVWISLRGIPSSGNFEASHENTFAASHVILLAAPRAGDHYVTVEADEIASSVQTIWLSATNSVFALDGVSPRSVGRNGNATLHLRGRELRSTMTVQLVGSSGETRDAIAVYWRTSTDCWATFNTTALGVGLYSVVATSDGESTNITDAVSIFRGSPGRVELQFIKCCEGGVRTGSVNHVTIIWRNVGDNDVTAPLLGLDAIGARLGVTDAFHQRRFTAQRLRWLGSARFGPAGILPPRDVNSRVVSFLLTMPPGDGFASIKLGQAAESAFTTLLTRPFYIPDTAWTQIVSNAMEGMGGSLHGLIPRLAQHATHLSLLGQRVVDMDTLLNYDLQLADGAVPVDGLHLETVTDLASNRTGSPLKLTRVYPTRISARHHNRSGFGVGWTHNHATSLLYGPGHAVLLEAHSTFDLLWYDDLGVYRGIPGTVTPTLNGLGVLRRPNGDVATYNMTTGHVLSVQVRQATSLSVMNYSYTEEGWLHAIVDTFDNSAIELYRDANSHITSAVLTDTDGRFSVVNYTYSMGGSLSSASIVGDHVIDYDYSAPHEMTRVRSDTGVISTCVYDSTSGILRGRQRWDSALGQLTAVDMSRDLTASGEFVLNFPAFPSPIGDNDWPTVGASAGLSSPSVTVMTNTEFRVAAVGGSGRSLRVSSFERGGRTHRVDSSVSSLFQVYHTDALELTDAAGSTTEIYIDASMGGVKTVRDRGGDVWVYVYDVTGRVIRIMYRGVMFRKFEYDSEGRLTSVTNPRLNTCWRTYAEGSLVETSWKDPLNTTLNRVRFSYDDERLTQADIEHRTDSANDNTTLEYTYDTLDRVVDVRQQSVMVASLTYLNRTTLLQDMTVHGVATWETRRPDLGSVQVWSEGSKAYDAAVDMNARPYTVGHGAVTATYEYYDNGDVRSVSLSTLTESDIGHIHYTYDGHGRVTSATGSWGAVTAKYDGISRLLSLVGDGFDNVTWQYADSGVCNELAVGGVARQRTVDAVERVVASGSCTFAYNPVDSVTANVVGVSCPNRTVTLAYDDDNRVSTMFDPARGSCMLQYSPSGVLLRLHCVGIAGAADEWTFVEDPVRRRVLVEYTVENDTRAVRWVNHYDDNGKLVFRWDAVAGEHVHYVRGVGGHLWGLLRNTTFTAMYPFEFAVGGGRVNTDLEEVPMHGGFGGSTAEVLPWLAGAQEDTPYGGSGTSPNVLHAQLRRVWTDASLYVSEGGRVYDAGEGMWLSAPPTHCDIPRTGYGVYGPSRPKTHEPRAGALPLWGTVHRGSVDGDKDVTSFNEAMGVATSRPGARPVPDKVGVIESSAGAFSEALVIGRLPGDTPPRESRVVAPDMIKSANFVNYEEEFTPEAAFQLMEEADNCESYVRCALLSQCGDATGAQSVESIRAILGAYGPTVEADYNDSHYCAVARCAYLGECEETSSRRHRSILELAVEAVPACFGDDDQGKLCKIWMYDMFRIGVCTGDQGGNVCRQLPDSTPTPTPGFNAPSKIDNYYFRKGVQGWSVNNIGAGFVAIVRLTTDSLGHFFYPTNKDMWISTNGHEGSSTVSRTFTVLGIRGVKLRYRFLSSELADGQAHNDYFAVLMRSKSGGRAVDAVSIGGLGLTAFNAFGSTEWRELTLNIDNCLQTDVVQVDITVCGAPANLFDCGGHGCEQNALNPQYILWSVLIIVQPMWRACPPTPLSQSPTLLLSCHPVVLHQPIIIR
jgi:hypothetical protein